MKNAVLILFPVLAFASPSLAQHMDAKGTSCQRSVATSDAAQCFVVAAKDADVELNRTYNTIQAFLQSEKRTDDGDALRKAQRAWIAYRDADCAAARALYGAGTGGPVTYWACMEANTRRRTEDLKVGYGWLLEKFGHSL